MGFTHLDNNGNVTMVDVGEKSVTHRIARASGCIRMSKTAFDAVMTDSIKKGNVFAASKIAGIMAAKNTSGVIPLCHPLAIEHIQVDLRPDIDNSIIHAEAMVKVGGKTGVEMEALHAVSIALLTIYDMVKAIDKSMIISDIMLDEKAGGKSGRYVKGKK